MNRCEYKGWTIEILDDSTYKAGSADNKFVYSNHYFGVDAREYPTSKHGIKIYQVEEDINSCIVIGSGGATGVHEHSWILQDDHLVICCCNEIFCLSIPDLDLKWRTNCDPATCFGIYKLEDEYIVHGEITITRLDRSGNIRWTFGGSDIFVSLDNDDAFRLYDDHIALTDFYKTKYKVGFDGREIGVPPKNK